ncbi:MAG TPA: ribokinase [Puia sp.]
MKKSKITVVGSSNTDMVIKADHLPGPGETILGGTFFMNPGGKGANQAVAAARLGGDVSFICKTGDDIFGRQSLQLFTEEGINTSFLISDSSHPSGVALITVDKNAENCIVVASGANAALNPSDLIKAREMIIQSSMILMQLEIPLDTVGYVAAIAFEKNIPVVLNPAPACMLPDSLLSHISILTPNKTEAEMLTGIKVHNIESAKEAAQKIRDRGVKTVIITLGSKGAIVLHDNVFSHIPSCPVTALDTTAAGDTFNGALVVALSEGKDILEATAYACKAAAISVTRIGAQASIPYKREVDAFIV